MSAQRTNLTSRKLQNTTLPFGQRPKPPPLVDSVQCSPCPKFSRPKLLVSVPLSFFCSFFVFRSFVVSFRCCVLSLFFVSLSFLLFLFVSFFLLWSLFFVRFVPVWLGKPTLFAQTLFSAFSSFSALPFFGSLRSLCKGIFGKEAQQSLTS